MSLYLDGRDTSDNALRKWVAHKGQRQPINPVVTLRAIEPNCEVGHFFLGSIDVKIITRLLATIQKQINEGTGSCVCVCVINQFDSFTGVLPQ